MVQNDASHRPAPDNSPTGGPKQLNATALRRLCLEAGADDVGFVEIGRPALDHERNDILAAYCMAVCPAGQAGRFCGSKKDFLQEVLLPLKNRKEHVYVLADTDAEKRARTNPHKEIRRIGFSIRR